MPATDEPADLAPRPHPEDDTSLVVLLGAGASFHADVPLTVKFVETLRTEIEARDVCYPDNAPLLPALTELLKFLEPRTDDGQRVDIEILYAATVRLASPSDDVFLSGRQGLPLGAEEARRLKSAIEAHIRAKAFVDPEKIGYLDELVALRGHEPLSVFSTNYDTCIELLCEKFQLRWEDGFRVRWEPEVFRDPGIHVRLHKIHGSVLWYRDASGSYLRTPIRPSDDGGAQVRWFGGACEPLLMYPEKKSAQDAPYAHGMLRLATLLGGRRRPMQLLVIGYSFRDDHLLQIVMDAARTNPELSVVLVDPDAHGIYERRMRGTDERPSPLRDRVFCVDDGLDKDGNLLRQLSRHMLRESADAFAAERGMARSAPRANRILRVAIKFGWVGDRHGHGRCCARFETCGDEVSLQKRLKHRAVDVVLCAQDAVGRAGWRESATELTRLLRSWIVETSRPRSDLQGDGFENWTFNARVSEKSEGVAGALREADGCVESIASMRSPQKAALVRAAFDWLAGLIWFVEQMETANKDLTARLQFPVLGKVGVLPTSLTHAEYGSDGMKARIDEGLDQYFLERAPDELILALEEAAEGPG